MAIKTIEISVLDLTATASESVAGNAASDQTVVFHVTFLGGTWFNLYKRMIIQSPKGTLNTIILIDENGYVTAPSGALDGEGNLTITLLGTNRGSSDYEIIYRASPILFSVSAPVNATVETGSDNLVLSDLYQRASSATLAANTAAQYATQTVANQIIDLQTRINNGEFDGTNGTNGIDGKEVELQKSSTHIQWRYVGEITWNDLVALDDLRGSDGTNGIDGTDGKEVQLQKTATHIQWKYDADVLWTNLVALSDIKGDKGDKGDTGDTGSTGPANTLTIGTVTGGATAGATITGTAPNQTLNLTLPNGADGSDGAAATIAIGTVTTGAPGTSASVTNSGTTNVAVLDFTIPRGDTGTAEGVAVTTGKTLTVTKTMTLTSPDDTSIATLPAGANTLLAANGTITGATKTKITYDAKGLITAGADATTADIADSTNKRYCTDAQKTVISNTSGTNTGDQTLSGLGGVPTSRTVNGKALSGNITLALASSDFVNQGTTATILHGNAAGSPYFGSIATADISNDAVTYAKIQNVSAADKILGRVNSGSGDIEEITCTAAGRALLDDADAATQRTTIGLGNVNNTSDATKQAAFLLAAYPVGSIYISVSATNPGTLFGGTWSAFASGRTLVGIDTSDTDFDTVEETRGTKTETLTTAQIPAHNHELRYGDGAPGTGGADLGKTTYASSGVYTHDTGGGGSHNNIQPSIVVYMFKRTA